ncbi:MAG: hypothetical protein ACYDH5_08865 [Acidimicrobiales bacterium]
MTAGDAGRTEPGSGIEPPFEELARAVDDARAAFDTLDVPARDAGLALQSAVERFHRPALVAFVRALRADQRGKELLFELLDDPVVRAVLALQGIIRPPVLDRAWHDLDEVPTEAFIPLSSIGRR